MPSVTRWSSFLNQIRSFSTAAQDRGLEIQFGYYKPKLKKLIKAIVAQQLYGTNAYEQVLNEGDEMIEKVKELSRLENDELVD